MFDLLLGERMMNFLKSGEFNFQKRDSSRKNEIVWSFLRIHWTCIV